VKFEFIRMPDSTGFGDYTKCGQVIPVTLSGRSGNYTHCMFLNDHPPNRSGRELWGFPKKLAEPTLRPDIDTLVGTLDYGDVRVATSTMGYKHHPLDCGLVRVCARVAELPSQDHPARRWDPTNLRVDRVLSDGHHSEGRVVRTGRSFIDPHALAPVAELPVLEVVSAQHILADLTLDLGKVVHDYLA